MMRGQGSYWYDQSAVDKILELFKTYLHHVKAPWIGRSFVLDQWQIDEFIAPLFGWKRRHDCRRPKAHDLRSLAGVSDPLDLMCAYGTRRYRSANLVLPRKNGKTSLFAGILLIGLCADGEFGGENYCMAGDLDQANDLVFDIACKMVEKSPELSARLRIYRSANRIIDPETESFLQAIPEDWEGALGFSPHIAILDEYLVQANTKPENAITSGMGTRRQPLFLRATTAPASVDSPAGRLIQRIRDIKAGLREAPPDELNVLYEAPADADWRKLKIWIMVNPGYGKSLQPAFVEGQIRRAEDEPSERAEILQYGLNIIPDGLDAWMPLEKWDAHGAALSDLSRFSGHDAVIALSFPYPSDLAAVAIVLPARGKEPLRLLTDFYLPSVALLRNNELFAPY